MSVKQNLDEFLSFFERLSCHREDQPPLQSLEVWVWKRGDRVQLFTGDDAIDPQSGGKTEGVHAVDDDRHRELFPGEKVVHHTEYVACPKCFH